MCIGPLAPKMPKMPKPIAQPIQKPLPQPEELKAPEPLKTEEDAEPKVKLNTKRESLGTRGKSPASRFASPNPLSTGYKGQGGLNL